MILPNVESKKGQRGKRDIQVERGWNWKSNREMDDLLRSLISRQALTKYFKKVENICKEIMFSVLKHLTFPHLPEMLVSK